MITTVPAIIDRARVYIDDDHDETPGWLTTQAWLDIFNAEYGEQYRTWIRLGLISVEPVDFPFVGPTVDLPEDPDTDEPVLSIVEVVEDTGSSYRLIPPGQSLYGRRPLRYPEDRKAQYWEAQTVGMSDVMTVLLRPEDSSGNYIVRYIPQAPRASILSTLATSQDPVPTLHFPDGTDERIVLGMARRAKLKEGTASALLERLIMQADADLRMTAFGRVNGESPRVRLNRGYFPRAGLPSALCPDRYGV